MQSYDPPARRRLYPWVGVLAGLVLVVAAAGAVDFIPGDVNDDGVFDLLDPTVLRRDLVGLEPGITQMCLSEVAATGQVTCWDSSGSVILCAGTGHDGAVRAGAALSYMDNGDGTITDLNTGLMWQKQSDDGSVLDKDVSYTWDETFSSHVGTLNVASFAGHTDWRVPNSKELYGLLDLERTFPSIDPAFDTGCVTGCTVTTCSCTASLETVYWSSTSLAFSPLGAWGVSFNVGFLNDFNKVEEFHVRAVRGGPPICGDGTLNRASEECDHPDDFACPGQCQADCTCQSICGDGTVDKPSEQCDDGDTQSGDCCSSTCQFESGPCESDGDVCTDDVCNGAGICIHEANTAMCDDGDSCTDPDQCQNGSCAPGPVCAAPLPNVVSTGCVFGSCEIESCFSTYHDVNQTYSDGCECQEDAFDQQGAGDSCATAISFGTIIDDGVSRATFSGNIVPGGDSDWFTVVLSDSSDALDAGISFDVNPSAQYDMHVYEFGCPGTGTFVGTCRSLTYFGAPGTDDTRVILVEVYRSGSGPPICDSYTLRVGHGGHSGTPGCNIFLP